MTRDARREGFEKWVEDLRAAGPASEYHLREHQLRKCQHCRACMFEENPFLMRLRCLKCKTEREI
jgi:hypothetical protein